MIMLPPFVEYKVLEINKYAYLKTVVTDKPSERDFRLHLKVNMLIKIHRTVILAVVLYGCETGSSH